MPHGALRVGELAPEFELMNQDKNPIRLADYRGKKKVVLLFYPMDFSPVCTREHCAFGPDLGKIRKDEETVVFGINCDHPFSHQAFRRQYNIPYDLLSDVTRKVVKAYGMWAGEEPFNCAKRGTVIVDKAGRVSYCQEVGPGDVRQVDDLAKAVDVEVALEQRADEFGMSV